MTRKFAAVVFSLGCLHASSSFALGLGDLTLDSFLNEPLKAHVDLLSTEGLHADQIRIRLATRDDFEKMGVERAYFLTSIKFDVSLDDRGRASIILSSEDPVLEPYLDFIVEARWPSGRLLREYTVLVDPPLFDESTPVVSATQRVAEVEGLPEPTSDGKKSQDPAATSGTRVDVKNKSNLAPGEMPDRDFNAQTSANPVPGNRYMIHRDDTLWEIASEAKPAGTSTHQTMLDIQRLNPRAFIDGNINRIKAGYIIYLPEEGDISSADMSAALAEVRQQNEDWEAGRASKPIASGPSLRISADSESESESDAEGGDADSYNPAASAAAAEEMEKAGLEQAEVTEQLAAMEQQVDTLQRIVSLKDDQIAALQQALAEAGGDEAATLIDVESGADADPMLESVDAIEEVAGAEDMDAGEAAESDAEAGDMVAAVVSEDTAEEPELAEPDPAPAPKPAPKPAPAAEEGGIVSYLLYGLGALALAILAFLFVRRGKGDDIDVREPPAVADDVFADVELKEQAVEVLPEEEPEPEPEPEQELEPDALSRDNRGYGERKHDEYASDVEAGDALAEADIYIAYGRYPQAVDLLKNAIANEPSNPVFRLKLLEMYMQMGDRPAAESEMNELEAINDAASLERAREIMSGAGTAATFAQPPEDLAEDLGAALEADFPGLEIEEGLGKEDMGDDLDLSSDFDNEVEDEDLVIAAEANGVSTKLDLARAYLDMGDDDGARQILEEVIAEGSEEQKSEAGALLERIG